MLLRSIRNSLISLSSVWRATPLFMFHQPNLPTSKLTSLKEWKPISITSLQDNPGARRYPKIVGRGPGSGKGFLIINSEKQQAEESRGINQDQAEESPIDSKEDRHNWTGDCPNLEEEKCTPLLNKKPITTWLCQHLHPDLLH